MKIIFLFIFLINQTVFSKDILIKVGFEEAPPLIVKDGSGILNKLLKSIEKKSHYKFSISYMTYGRAIRELKQGRIDLIGMTPYRNETKSFYEFAEDLDWSFRTWNVLFYNKADKNKFDLNEFMSIGTLPGNEDFMSRLYHLPKARFHSGSLKSLFKMLKRKRLDAVLFEYISAQSAVEELKLQNVEVRKVSPVHAGFSTRKSFNSIDKKKLSAVIKSISINQIFEGYEHLLIFDELTRLKVNNSYIEEVSPSEEGP